MKEHIVFEAVLYIAHGELPYICGWLGALQANADDIVVTLWTHAVHGRGPSQIQLVRGQAHASYQ